MFKRFKPTSSRIIAAGGCLVALLFVSITSSADQKATQRSITPQAKNAEGKLISTNQPDILVKNIKLTEDGEVQYEIGNRAYASVNQPFFVDIHVGNSQQDRVQHDYLYARTNQTRVSDKAHVVSCQGSWVRVVSDSNHAIQETNESNNERRQLEKNPTCPDLAITYGPAPKKHKKAPPGRYWIQVVVGNIGTGSTSRAAVVEILYGQKGLKHVLRTEVPPLEPGETKKIYTSDEHLGWRTGWVVDVRLDPTNVIDEHNERNNRKRWSN